MKKIIFTLSIIVASYGFASAQVLPSIQFGVKGGVNLSTLEYSASTFNSSNRAGVLAGIWARFGALGFNFQPELYYTTKNVELNSGPNQIRGKFSSLDVPLLFGGKIGAFGLGARFYAGPLVSFAINKDQSVASAIGDLRSLDYKDQNFAITGGVGIDIRKISVDLRYEAGLTKQGYENSHTRVSLFNLSLAYRLF